MQADYRGTNMDVAIKTYCLFSDEACELECAACHSGQDVRAQDEFGDVSFCDDCLDGVRTLEPNAELGGES